MMSDPHTEYSLVFDSHTPRANALGVYYIKHLVKIVVQQSLIG